MLEELVAYNCSLQFFNSLASFLNGLCAALPAMQKPKKSPEMHSLIKKKLALRLAKLATAVSLARPDRFSTPATQP